jgi:hypothetical protein
MALLSTNSIVLPTTYKSPGPQYLVNVLHTKSSLSVLIRIQIIKMDICIMEMNFNRLGVLTMATTLAACASSLLWQTEYDTPEVTIAQSVAIDADDNVYVGGSTQTGLINDRRRIMDGLLLGYNAAGELVWETQLPDAITVNDVKTVNGDVLAVVAGDFKGFFGSINVIDDTANKQGELLYVSTKSGELLKKLHTYADDTFVAMDVFDEKLYVSSNNKSGSSSISVFDVNGDEVTSILLSDQTISHVELSETGNLFLDTGGSIQRYNSDLDLVWATDPECPVVAMYAVPNGSVFVECKEHVSKIDASGAVTFSTDLNLFLTQTSSIWEYWLSDYDDLFMPTVGTVDADGNLYFARSRAKVYALDGAVNLGALTVEAPSTLSADAVLFKIDGSSGDILWTDDINAAIFGTADGFTSQYYYPMDLNVDGQEVSMTFRGIVGRYVSYIGTECALFTHWEFPFNTCVLDSMKDTYAKTLFYNTSSGKRALNKVGYDISYPRATVSTHDGNRIVIGDENDRMPENIIEMFALGLLGEEQTSSENFNVQLKKYKQ